MAERKPLFCLNILGWILGWTAFFAVVFGWVFFQWNECRDMGFGILYCIQHVA